MRALKRELKKELDVCAQRMEIDPAGKKAALERIAQQAGRKKLRYRPGPLAIWKAQLLSVPQGAWILQGVFLLLIPCAEQFLREKTQVQGWEIFPFLSVCMAVGAAALINGLSGHFSCKMAELEQSCYLNLSQLWLMRACCVCGVDVLWIFLLGAGRAQYYGFGWFAFSVYVLTPFFLANAALLAFFTLGRERKRAGQVGIAALAAAFLWVECFGGWLYETVWLPLWIALFVTAFLLCAMQVQEIGRKMEGEGLCWN